MTCKHGHTPACLHARTPKNEAVGFLSKPLGVWKCMMRGKKKNQKHENNEINHSFIVTYCHVLSQCAHRSSCQNSDKDVTLLPRWKRCPSPPPCYPVPTFLGLLFGFKTPKIPGIIDYSFRVFKDKPSGQNFSLIYF